MEEQRHRTFSNILLKGKLRKAVQFVCGREKGGVFQPAELAKYLTGTINETVTSVLEGKHPSKRIPSCSKLETYEGTHIFIPVMHKRSESSGPRGMDSEALQGWLLKFGEDGTRLRTSVETFVDWLANGSPP